MLLVPAVQNTRLEDVREPKPHPRGSLLLVFLAPFYALVIPRQCRPEPVTQAPFPSSFLLAKPCCRCWIVMDTAELSSTDHRTSQETLEPVGGRNTTRNRRASATEEACERRLATDWARRRHRLFSETKRRCCLNVERARALPENAEFSQLCFVLCHFVLTTMSTSAISPTAPHCVCACVTAWSARMRYARLF